MPKRSNPKPVLAWGWMLDGVLQPESAHSKRIMQPMIARVGGRIVRVEIRVKKGAKKT